MLKEDQSENIFKEAKIKYKNTRFLKNNFEYYPKKSEIVAFFFDSEEKNNRENIKNYLRKICKDKFHVQRLNFSSKIIGSRNLNLIPKNIVANQRLYYVYFRNFKEALKVKLVKGC